MREGYVKVIVTTNFDRLLENALREEGVEPTVIASIDALKGAEPLVHTSCYLLKLHGDYKDARILNTEEELAAYPAEYDALLDRIVDEYGLIVCGWSGEWDHALRAVLLRAPTRRYPLFWATRGRLGGGADDIVRQRDARAIEITDGDSFFEGLEQRVATLARTHRQNPLSVELLVNTTKRYLAKPEHRIQLDDLVTSETRSLIGKLDDNLLNGEGGWSPEEFRRRIALYESLSEPLARMAGVLGRWGDGSEKALALDVIEMLSSHADQSLGGLNVWLDVRAYPAVLFMTGYGLGLTRSRRWSNLHDLLVAPIQKRNERGTERAVEKLFLSAWPGGNNDYWKNLDGFERRKTALSDQLSSLYQDWSKSFVGASPDFERLYESWEILGGLVYLERTDIGEIDAALAQDSPNGWVWFPIGRSGWHEDMREQILEGLLSDPMRSELLEAGFANRDTNFLSKTISNYRRLAGRMRW
ncbi:SIR2 family protein [Phyllobacterium sp. LjRoot231]|uniref:SIR2 family protein n=1 Tax=Phyllobacterium sp. LjRoot231 TaxID=3342289 RepID=UPI003ED066A0